MPGDRVELTFRSMMYSCDRGIAISIAEITHTLDNNVDKRQERHLWYVLWDNGTLEMCWDKLLQRAG